jgi:hypothetical protein
MALGWDLCGGDDLTVQGLVESDRSARDPVEHVERGPLVRARVCSCGLVGPIFVSRGTQRRRNQPARPALTSARRSSLRSRRIRYTPPWLSRMRSEGIWSEHEVSMKRSMESRESCEPNSHMPEVSRRTVFLGESPKGERPVGGSPVSHRHSVCSSPCSSWIYIAYKH